MIAGHYIKQHTYKYTFEILQSYSKLQTEQMKYICITTISIPFGQFTKKKNCFTVLYHEITSWHIICYIKQCFVYQFANVFLDYVKELCYA